MTKEEFVPVLFDFIKRRLNGDELTDIVSDYIDKLSMTQMELMSLHDYLVHKYPQDLVDAMNNKSSKALIFIGFITEGWMARAQLSKQIYKNNTNISIPITKN